MSAVLSDQTMALAREFTVAKGRLVMPDEAFSKWRKSHATLSAPQRKERRVELIALTLTFSHLGTAAKGALAQLVVLLSDLVAEPKPTRAKAWR